MKIIKRLALTCCVITLFYSCAQRNDSSAQLKLDFRRLEQKLFDKGTSGLAKLHTLRSEFGPFADLYLKQVVGLAAENDTMLATEMDEYRNDRYIKEVNDTVQKVFSDLKWLEEKLAAAFSNYKNFFPEKPVPAIFTFTAPFNYNVVASDSVLGIGLDMYLGSDYRYYTTTGFPLYKIRKLSSEYMACDAVKAWLQSDYEEVLASNDLLNNMLYEGRIIYALKQLLPEENDTIVFGYSKDELKWLKNNEENVWNFFIEQKLLFNKNPGDFIKFINDGAGTGGFPEEAPSRIGVYIGYRIAESYAEQHEVNLSQLMLLNDGNKMLIESGYKPRKK